MWQLSRQSRHIRHAFDDYKPNFNEMRSRVIESTNVKTRHFSKQIEDLSQDAPSVRYSPKEDGGGGTITLFDGYASFDSPHTIEILKNNNEQRMKIKSDYFLIATGSRPRICNQFDCFNNIENINNGTNQIEHILTSDDLLSKLDSFPKSLLIYGGGVIGCEFATIFSNFGMCNNIYLFNERRHRLLPHEDEDLSLFLNSNFQQTNNVNVLNNVKMKNIKINKNTNKVECIYNNLSNDLNSDKNDEMKYLKLEVDKVLLAIGREPNLDGLNLDKAGIKTDKQSGNKKLLTIDGHLRVECKYNNIFACGDALGKWGLVSVAEMEARHAVEVMFAKKNPQTKLDYKHISSVMFVRPEIACVGLNEQDAQKRKIAYKAGLLRLGLVNRAVIDWNERHYGPIEPRKAGFIKLIATDDDDKRLIGMRAVGNGASTVIQTASLLIRNGQSIRELDRVAHPHPAITEGVQECARMLLGRGIYKPHVWPRSHVTHYSPQLGTAFSQEMGPKRYQQLVPGYMG